MWSDSQALKLTKLKETHLQKFYNDFYIGTTANIVYVKY